MQAGGRLGWTGFTWDKHLFPNAKAFLSWYGIYLSVVKENKILNFLGVN